jgi:hypothetical protein
VGSGAGRAQGVPTSPHPPHPLDLRACILTPLRHPLTLTQGMEALLGGGRSGTFDLKANVWGRKGWAEMDVLRKKLEDIKELRDLVRSLGR